MKPLLTRPLADDSRLENVERYEHESQFDSSMVRKDLLLFFADRRSVIMASALPILIASFFGSVFSGSSSDAEPARIAIAIIDDDGSTISRAIVSGLQGDRNLQVALPTEDDARASVKHGRTSVAAIIPSGFGDAAGQAFFGSAPKPALDRLYDLSRSAEVAMVRGMLTEHVMQAVSREIFGGAQGRQYVERMLPQIEASQSLPPDQKRLLTEMLRWCRSSTTARIRPRRPPDPGCRCRTRSASRR